MHGWVFNMKNNILIEQWDAYKKLPNRYAVSTWGRILSLKTGRIIKTSIDKYGYERLAVIVGSRTDKTRKHLNLKIHQMVAETFISPQPEKGFTVNHIDGNKTNNFVENLEWCTNSDNLRRGWESGLFNSHYKNL